MHFLVIDSRFAVPIFVFLEADPNEGGLHEPLPGRWVTLDQANAPKVHAGKTTVGLGDKVAIGGDPKRVDRFAMFASEGAVRAAGYSIIEPRYLGPSWDTYLSVFHPEGGKRCAESKVRRRDVRVTTKTRAAKLLPGSGE